MAEHQKKKKRQRAPKRWILAMGLMVPAALLVALIINYVLDQANHTVEGAKVPNISSRVSGASGGNSSPAYLKLIGEKNAEDYERAQKAGSTNVPSFAGSKIPPAPEAQSPSVPRRVDSPQRTSQTATVAARQQDRDFENRKRQYISFLKKELKDEPVKMATYSFKSSGESKQEERKTESASSQKTTNQNEDPTAPLGLVPGNVLYVVNDFGLNSDVPTEGMGTVMNGPGKTRNATLFGGYQVSGEHMVLRYKTLTTEDGQTFSINGLAINPETLEADMTQEIDYHRFERFTGIALASIAKGLGIAAQQSGSVTTTGVGIGGGVSTTTNPKYNVGDRAMIAAGEVGEALSNDFSKMTNIPPTMKIPEGALMAVVIFEIR